MYGGCQGGDVRYAATGRPVAVYVCHCTECHEQSAPAFGIPVTVSRDALHLQQGSPRYWSRPTASGHTLDRAFCPACGARLWHQGSCHPDTLNIKGGSLDAPLDLTEAIHIWTASRLPGVTIPTGARAFPGEPDDGT